MTPNSLATDEDVVDLHQGLQLAAALLIEHHLHELVFEQPSAAIADPEMAHELQGGHAGLGLREQMDRQKPDRQWQLAGIEHRTGGQAGLMAASAALKQQTLPAFVPTVLSRAASWASKAARPARLQQYLLALLARAVQREKLGQRKPRLQLNAVGRHGTLQGRNAFMLYRPKLAR